MTRENDNGTTRNPEVFPTPQESAGELTKLTWSRYKDEAFEPLDKLPPSLEIVGLVWHDRHPRWRQAITARFITAATVPQSQAQKAHDYILSRLEKLPEPDLFVDVPGVRRRTKEWFDLGNKISCAIRVSPDPAGGEDFVFVGRATTLTDQDACWLLRYQGLEEYKRHEIPKEIVDDIHGAERIRRGVASGDMRDVLIGEMELLEPEIVEGSSPTVIARTFGIMAFVPGEPDPLSFEISLPGSGLDPRGLRREIKQGVRRLVELELSRPLKRLTPRERHEIAEKVRKWGKAGNRVVCGLVVGWADLAQQERAIHVYRPPTLTLKETCAYLQQLTNTQSPQKPR